MESVNTPVIGKLSQIHPQPSRRTSDRNPGPQKRSHASSGSPGGLAAMCAGPKSTSGDLRLRPRRGSARPARAAAAMTRPGDNAPARPLPSASRWYSLGALGGSVDEHRTVIHTNRVRARRNLRVAVGAAVPPEVGGRGDPQAGSAGTARARSHSERVRPTRPRPRRREAPSLVGGDDARRVSRTGRPTARRRRQNACAKAPPSKVIRRVHRSSGGPSVVAAPGNETRCTSPLDRARYLAAP